MLRLPGTNGATNNQAKLQCCVSDCPLLWSYVLLSLGKHRATDRDRAGCPLFTWTFCGTRACRRKKNTRSI